MELRVVKQQKLFFIQYQQQSPQQPPIQQQYVHHQPQFSPLVEEPLVQEPTGNGTQVHVQLEHLKGQEQQLRLLQHPQQYIM